MRVRTNKRKWKEERRIGKIGGKKRGVERVDRGSSRLFV